MKAWQHIGRLIGYRLGPFLLICLFSVVSTSVVGQAFGLLIRLLFDTLTGTARIGLTPITICALIVAVGLARAGTSLLMILNNAINRFFASAVVRQNLFEHLLSRPGALGLLESPGESVARYRDDGVLVGRFVWNMPYLVGSAGFAIVAAVVMVRTNARITVLVFAPLIVVVVLCRFAFRFVGQFHDVFQSATTKVTGLIGEVFGMVEAVKVSRGEARVVREFENRSHTRLRAALKDRVLDQLLNTLFNTISTLATCGIVLSSARFMQAGTLSVGDFALFMYYLNWVTHIIFQFGGNLAFYKRIGISFGRLAFLLDGESDAGVTKRVAIDLRSGRDGAPTAVTASKPGLDEPLSLLEARGLSFTYPGSENGVFDISLSIPRGAFVVVTGRVASGKTTLLRTLLGLLTSSSGEVLWNGRRLESLAEEMIPPRVAYTPQIAKLFDDTLRDNILLGLAKDACSLDHAVRLAVLEEDVKSLGSGLETLVGSRGIKLSGGQKQRAAAARMFVREPELMIVDDLSSALDVETEKLLWERIRGHREARTTSFLVVSYRREVLRQADEVVVMKRGRMVSHGSLAEVLQSSDELQAIWRGDLCVGDGTEEPQGLERS